ncbi:MAG: hypothetical protein WC936_00690 [Candidatus Nanoarchaeia archaeon]|jgi:hypothetical protein
MFDITIKMEYPKIAGLEEIVMPVNGSMRFCYSNERVLLERDEISINVYVLSRGMLATAMPYFHKRYGINSTKGEILKDLEEYFINKNINKK